jgi:hypothetical protein
MMMVMMMMIIIIIIIIIIIGPMSGQDGTVTGLSHSILVLPCQLHPAMFCP